MITIYSLFWTIFNCSIMALIIFVLSNQNIIYYKVRYTCFVFFDHLLYHPGIISRGIP